ncbi:MAG TPA: hypothetical protein P5509_05015 [Bacteroidales bacterium]|nr:hypothetical protein [Bacteroidales bacterium]
MAEQYEMRMKRNEITGAVYVHTHDVVTMLNGNAINALKLAQDRDLSVEERAGFLKVAEVLNEISEDFSKL